MTTRPLRILLLADTHLGIDLPQRPRIERRRRGDDFFANYLAALAPALQGQVDLVVHGGDVLFRSRVPASLVRTAFEPLLAIARAGTPVLVVPGNHERSAIPFPLLASHPRIHVFDRPRTWRLELGGIRVAAAGFPYAADVRQRFPQLLAQTGWREGDAEVRLLCMHHAVEGARVGPADFAFRHQPDVVRCCDLPAELAAVLSGHIHRHQVLDCDLAGRPLAAPVLYPGSIERTSFAERDETKGYLLLEIQPDERGGRLENWRFAPLHARPMFEVVLPAPLSQAELREQLVRRLSALPNDAIVRVKPSGPIRPEVWAGFGDAELRELAPATMNVALAFRAEPGAGPRA